ncbi:hypothetical protein BEWA_020970 [Theileria equi strain WA]|uniref:Uncharacterized protein n=1 Tax=Theileria equi strain WA TaxID=1537102 RepID=L0AUL8_THEEQ|nr:hypothetical protein BEWA_020970 [Theileria equi strain WA]AFZ79250.1 hypothetical protein BEWA_020970 [Theileria equi strain WA]|eukprot:XP_004828916.1 hypothetical protein BEWA_020970 [Theileria equi strain WA]
MSGRNTLKLKLDISKKCGEGDSQCSCSPKPDGIKVSKVTGITNANGFVALVHKSDKPFKLLQSLGDDEQLKNDIPSVKTVAVYYWDGDDDFKRPLLLEVETSSGGKQYYYKYEQDECEAQNDTSTWKYNPGNHSLQERLDDRYCGRNHAIPFDIKELTKNHATGRSACLKKTRSITESTSPPQPHPGGGYTIQEYEVNGSDTKISRVTFGGQDTRGIDPKNDEISKIRLFIQNNVSSGPPLMLQFMKQDGDSKWFYNQNSDGTDWGSVDNHSKFYGPGDEPTEKLTTALDDVRCVRDSAVTLNLSFENSETHSSGTKYCCRYHDTSVKKVTVTPVQISCMVKDHPSSKLTAYKHSIESNMKLAGIKYYVGSSSNNNDRKNITGPGLDFPISAPVTISAFYCNENGNGPVLIYVDSKGNAAKGWFKKGGTQDSEDWTPVPSNLDSITPDNFSTLNREQWKVFVGLLKGAGCNELKECPPDNSSKWIKIGSGVTSTVGTGGAAYGGWYAWVNYFLDPLVRLI